ncbi:LPXTG cell wall anchor domain-containing protein [Streptomyces carpinensis]|uniref:LPXTG cell wall anchor domain-containing protein n=1 Tax=Streptomyces carpinensis TaxID=66369 RepID=A0ABV1VZU9_9ACTN|nr:LPXTG cell wall anchor domain-containing protein [Streptomyces carpinensis]
MRTLIRAGALSAGVSAALVLAPAAHAASHASRPGDNGTVKIHDAKTGEELRRNEPHVCTFYLDAFGFDGVQEVHWHIEAWAPKAATKGETVKSGDITLNARGHGRTEDLSLPDGHYKLFWNFDGEKGAAKHKVFWTDCAPEHGGSGSTPGGPGSTPGGPGSAPGGTDTPGASASPTAGASSSAPASSSASASSAAAPAASSSPSAQGGASGDLAATGSSAPVGLLSGVAAALVGAGGFLVLRRRARRG